MASRKKQDEKNLKTLRELATISSNKYCFDCNQIGPTYVDVTIGSFVCTKCSGLLRGLTPPHRVKSISMATFSADEIALLEHRGNDYCRRVWLGLFDGVAPTETARDEQTVKDFMIDKYERKRHYLDPARAHKNGHAVRASPTDKRPTEPKAIAQPRGAGAAVNGRKRPEVSPAFAKAAVATPKVADDASFANFETADIFVCPNNNNYGNGGATNFANFDNNPVFTQHSNHNTQPLVNQMNNQQNNLSQNNSSSNVPAEDKYAALKDLDNALKSQATIDWSSTGSNGSLYSSPTPSSSMYSSPSPQSSLFGSPSQGQFINGFTADTNNTISNPFNTNGFLWNGNGIQANGFSQSTVNGLNSNPFNMKDVSISKTNGIMPPFQNGLHQNGNIPWTPNPFKVGGATTMTGSYNPFL